MKKVRKFILLTFGLLMICLTLSLVNHKVNVDDTNINNSTSEKMGSTLPDFIPFSSVKPSYKGGIRLVYTTNPFYEADSVKGVTTDYVTSLADVVAVGGKKTIYVSFYYVIEDGSKGTNIRWNLSELTASSINYTIMDCNAVKSVGQDDLAAIGAERDAILQEYMSTLDMTLMTKYQEYMNLYNNYNTWLNSSGTFDNMLATKHFTNESRFAIDGDGRLQAQLGVGTNIGPGEYLMGKLKLEIPDTASSFNMSCSEWVASYGRDTGDVIGTYPNPTGFSVGLGQGSLNKVVDTVGTWSTNGKTINLIANHTDKTLTGTIPYDVDSATDITISLTTDGGKGTNTLDGTTGTWNGYKVNIPSAGSSVVATVTAYSQAFKVPTEDEKTTAGFSGTVYEYGETLTENATLFAKYTLTLTRRSSDISSLTLTGKDSSNATVKTYSLSDLVLATGSTNTYNLPSGDVFAWNVKNVSATVSCQGTASVGTPTSWTEVPAATVKSGNVSFTVTNEIGATETYTINFDRAAGDDNLDIADFTVLNSGSDLDYSYVGTVSGEEVYELDYIIAHGVQSLDITVTLPTGSLSTITGTGAPANWTGSPSVNFSTAGDKGLNNTTANSNFSYKFTVKTQLGKTRTYVIKGEREFLKSSTTTTTGKWSGTGGATNPSNVVLATQSGNVLKGIIPANFASTSITVVLTTADNGTNSLETQPSGTWSGSAGTYTVTVPNKGSSVEATFKAMAQAYDPVINPTAYDTYTVILERRASDIVDISVTGTESSQTFPNLTETNGVFTLPSNLEWNVENLSVSVNLTDSTKTKVNNGSSNDISFNIGIPSVTELNPTNGGSKTFDLYENGIKIATYNIEFTRNAGSGDADLDTTSGVGISVWDPSDNTYYTVLAPSAANLSNEWVYVIDENVPFEILSLNFLVDLKDTNEQYIKIVGGNANWNGGSIELIDTTGNKGANNTVESTFTIKFVVYPQIPSKAKTYVIQGTRDAANGDVSLTGELIGNKLQENGLPKTYAIPTKAAVNNTVTFGYPTFVLNEDNVKFDFNIAATSKLYFGQDQANLQEWNSTMAASAYIVGDHLTPETYYAKVVAQNGSHVTYVFEIYHEDLFTYDFTLDDLKVYGVKTIDGVTSKTELNPVDGVGSSTAKNFNPSDLGKYYYEISYKQYDSISVEYKKNATAKSVYSDTTGGLAMTSISVSSLPVGTSDYSYYVESDAGTFDDPYVIVINRGTPRTGAYLTNVKVTHATGTKTIPTNVNDPSGTIYSETVPYDTTQVQITFGLADGATVPSTKASPVTVNIVNHVGRFDVTVTSEKGDDFDYTIMIYAVEEGIDLTNIKLFSYDSFDSATNDIIPGSSELVDSDGNLLLDFSSLSRISVNEIILPYSVSRVYIKGYSTKLYPQYSSGFGDLTIQPGTSNAKTVTLYATSHYASVRPDVLNTLTTEKTDEYKIKFIRLEADTEKDIDTFEAYAGPNVDPLKVVGTSDLSFAPGLPTITIGNFDSDTYDKVTVRFTVETPNKATVTYDGSPVPVVDGKYQLTMPLVFNNGVAENTINVTDEKGDTKPYKIIVQTNSLVPPTMPVITGIQIIGSYTTTNYLDPFNAGEMTKTITLDKNENRVQVNVTISGGSAGSSYKIEYTLTDSTSNYTTGSSAYFDTNIGETIVKIYPFTTDGDGTPYVYTLKREEASKVNTISSVTIGTETNTPTGGLDFDLPNGSTSTTVSVQLDDPKAKATLVFSDGTTLPLTVDPTTGVATGTISGLNPGVKPITINVDPEDAGTPEKNYPMTVTVDQPTAAQSIKVTSLDGATNYELVADGTNKYKVNIPYGVDYVNVTVELPSSVDQSKFVMPIQGSGTINVSSSVPAHEVVVKTIANATTPTTYTINFIKATPSTGNQLLDFDLVIPVDADGDGNNDVVEVPDFVPGKTSYDIILPAGITSYEFQNVVVSQDATYTLDVNTTLTNGVKNERKITVKSQGGDENPYVFNMYVAQTECEVKSIKVLDQNNAELVDLDGNKLVFTAGQLPYSLRVANTVTGVQLVVEYSTTATLKVNGQTYTGGYNENIPVLLTKEGTANPNVISVQALSQLYGINSTLGASYVSGLYEISIVREELDGEARLDKLELYVDGVNKIVGFNEDKAEYIVDDLGSIANVRIIANAKSVKGIIQSVSASAVHGSRTFDDTISLTGLLNTSLTAQIIITVKAENGDTKPYTILISRGAIDPEDDNTVSKITLIDNESTNYINPFVDTQNEYIDILIPVGSNYFTITADKLPGSYATIYITDETFTKLNTAGDFYTENITKDNWGKTLTYYVFAEAQDPAAGRGTQYKIVVTIDKPSDDSSAASIKIDGVEQITADNPEGPYILGVPYDTSSVHLFVESTHEKAEVKVDLVTKTHIYTDAYPLKVGMNPIRIEIFAEDGTSTIYNIEITRSAEAPKLDTLEVSGTYLRDELGNRILFDPVEKQYYVIVPYEKDEVEIIATSTMGVVHGTGVKPVNVGSQDFAVQVVAPNGMATSYNVNVLRLPEAYANSFAEYVKIQEVQELDNDFKPTKTTGYAYTVPNNITDLNVSVKLQFEDDNVKDDLYADYVIYGDKNLRVGLNNVVVVVKSADGLHETTYLIQVTRLPKQYDVNNKDESVKSYDLEQNKDASGNLIANEYTVNIGNKKTSEVDFTKFIENLDPTNQNLEVSVLTDVSTNPDEVVVRITDGDETEFVKFQVKSTGNPTGFQGEEWTFLLLLGIILIILLAILFTVNKDKYGKITKKTNRRNERKEKKEDAKRK